jgi:hypothetical protein
LLTAQSWKRENVLLVEQIGRMVRQDPSALPHADGVRKMCLGEK